MGWDWLGPVIDRIIWDVAVPGTAPLSSSATAFPSIISSPVWRPSCPSLAYSHLPTKTMAILTPIHHPITHPSTLPHLIPHFSLQLTTLLTTAAVIPTLLPPRSRCQLTAFSICRILHLRLLLPSLCLLLSLALRWQTSSGSFPTS